MLRRKRTPAAVVLASTIAMSFGCGGAGDSQTGAAGTAGGNAGSGGGASVIENVTFPLGARVYATAMAKIYDPVPLYIVGTTDPQSPIKLLTFDLDARTWAVKYEVKAGGALPQGPHRIDAIAVLFSLYAAPNLVFSARREDTLENEGLFLAVWDPITTGGYKVTLVDGTNVPGRVFVSIDADALTNSRPVVAACVDMGAASPKTAAMLWSVDQETTMTLLGSLPGDPAVDPAPSPIARRPVVVQQQDSTSALVWQRRKPDGGVVLTLTSFTRTAFGASVDLPLAAGVDLVDNSNAASRASSPYGGAADYVLFLGSDGNLYHLELDVPTANLVLVRGPETAAAGTSLVVGRFDGGYWNDLVQGGVPGSPGLELQIGKFAPIPLFAPRPGPTSSIATGPVRWPIPTRAGSLPSVNEPPETRTFIFAVTTGASGAYDTALLSIVPPPPAQYDAMACFKDAMPPTPSQQPFTCALPEPCAVATGSLPSGAGSPTAPTLDVAAGKCVLQRLRDGAPAHLTVSMSLINGSVVEDIWTAGDGTAVLWRHDIEDLFWMHYVPTRLALRDQAFFDACLRETAAKAVVRCLFSWWVDSSCATTGPATCPAH